MLKYPLIMNHSQMITVAKTLAGVVVILLIVTGITYASLSSSKKKVVETEAILASTTQQLDSVTFEKNELVEKLAGKEIELNDLNKKYKKLDKKTDELEKLTKTDKQLLEKYSKVYFLNEHYTPTKLATVTSEYLSDKSKSIQIHAEVYPFLEDMIKDAEDDGVVIKVVSGYRSFETQKDLKSAYAVTYGAGTANQFSADQGYSEHQLGTTVDVATPGSNLTIAFETTKAFSWLKDYAYRYGFVLSYPKNNKYYQYEPWHWRFVGKDLARKLHKEKKYFYDYDQRNINDYLVELFD